MHRRHAIVGKVVYNFDIYVCILNTKYGAQKFRCCLYFPLSLSCLIESCLSVSLLYLWSSLFRLALDVFLPRPKSLELTVLKQSLFQTAALASGLPLWAFGQAHTWCTAFIVSRGNPVALVFKSRSSSPYSLFVVFHLFYLVFVSSGELTRAAFWFLSRLLVLVDSVWC